MSDTETLMRQYPILSAAWDECTNVWKGIAIPCEKSTASGDTIESEKVVKFSRKHLRKRYTKADSRVVGHVDHMLVKVGTPGSEERLEALKNQYAFLQDNEQSPFGEQ